MNEQKLLEQARQVFIESVDSEDRAENERVLAEWEQSIVKNKAYEDWKNHDITREINQKLRKLIIDFAVTLSENRSLDEKTRMSLWAKQDACLLMLSLTDENAKSALESIQREIRHALSVTSS